MKRSSTSSSSPQFNSVRRIITFAFAFCVPAQCGANVEKQKDGVSGRKSEREGFGVLNLEVAMASGLAKWAGELAKGVHGYWANGRWTPLAISARNRAKLRKETLLAGGEWPYDAPRRPERTKMKGHKVDREAAIKRARTVELMAKMPQMLADMKKRRWERKAETK